MACQPMTLLPDSAVYKFSETLEGWHKQQHWLAIEIAHMVHMALVEIVTEHTQFVRERLKMCNINIWL